MSRKEAVVARLDELKDGEMKEVSEGETKILLARVGGRIHAVGAHCPHYGAPLAEGVLHGERIVCPWHHACFNVTTGDLLEPPAFDALPCYEVKIENDQISVVLPDDAPDRRTPAMTKRVTNDTRLFVILGGGAAGYMAAQTLREDGFKGRVVMVTRENRAPYDRPNLSKDYLQGHAESEWMPLRPDDFFEKYDIEIWEGKEVEHVDAADKSIKFADGRTLFCDALLIATGGEPRRLPFQTEGQENVFLLRSFADADKIIAAADEGKRVVVIGASFIGMEGAASLKTRGCDVTVVAPDEIPFKKILGAEIGKLFQNIHEENGVKFRLGAGVTGFGGEGAVEAVVLENGERIDCDLVVVGVGVKPATPFLQGIELNKDGGVVVNEYFQTTAEGVYAAGDIAYFPSPLNGERQRIEHWRTALQQGRIAAHNMAGRRTAFASVPFFWTAQFDASLSYVGHAETWDETIFRGKVDEQDFLAFYVCGGKVMAAAGMNRDREIAAVEELMRIKRLPSPDDLRGGRLNLLELFS
jgi:NADPH-dependent 2,4-dienoyl-CoA reductase/sulfur reductase-like enzyme/nitrite reductase/ring-hydroxylating ferredoxin subunit